MSSEEKHARGNKYLVTVSPSSSPNRRVLVSIVVAVAVVALVVLLSTLIPIYATGKGKPDTSNEQLSEQQSGDDFPTTENSSSTSIAIGFTTKSRRHSSNSVDSTSTKHEESPSLQTTNISPSKTISSSKDSRVTTSYSRLESLSSSSEFGTSSTEQSAFNSVVDSNSTISTASSLTSLPNSVDTMTTKHEESPYFHTTNIHPTVMISSSEDTRVAKSRLESISSSSGFETSSSKERSFNSVVDSSKSTAESVTASLTRPSNSVETSSLGPLETKSSTKATVQQGQTWSLPEVKPSVKATSTDTIRKGQTSTLPKMTSLTTATSSMSAAPIISSVSNTFSASSIVGVAVIANLVPNTESKWTRWSSWSDCTKTCGTGTRQRNRTCVAINKRAVFAPISCAGKAEQVKSCAEWSCPDCSKNCTIGTLNDACDACTCAHHVLTGRILTEDGAPLSEVNISLAETPYNILAQTNVSGFFTTLGVCAGQQLQELLVTKAGFAPVRQNATVLTPTVATITLKMEIAVPPYITVHPVSKMRMPGQGVTFCCDGEGNPPPEIEWFKDNNVIDKDLFNYDKTLELFDTRGLKGSYRCRAVNMFGAEFSDTASLDVLELNQDSCSPTPISKNVTLPPGCVLNGTNTSIVDVGECQPEPCLKNDSVFNSSCHDPSFCCGPRDFTQVLIDCGDIMSFNLSKVKYCSCGSCTEKVTTVQGIVVGGPQEKPVRYGDVIYNGQVVASTDRKGKFSFTISGNVKRAIVTFKDLFYEDFEERNKILEINEGSTDFHKIKLKQKPPPIAFNASEPLDIPLGSDPFTDSFADLELPEETFLKEDGSVFQGNAKATVSVTDPRNLSDILTAPGDFSTTDEEGESEMLETYGMLKLNFEDESGKKLAMSKPMKVSLDPEKFNLTIKNSSGDIPLKLYWLDKKTERWREVGDFQREDGNKRRRKRSNRVFLVTTVTPAIAQETLNFDWPHIRVAVRVVAEKKVQKWDGTIETQRHQGVTVRVIKKEAGTTRYSGYTEKTTDSHGIACIPIWRGEQCTIQAESNGFYNEPKDLTSLPKNIEASLEQRTEEDTRVQWVDFKSKLGENSTEASPMYNHTDDKVKKCQSNVDPLVKGAQFIFQEPQTDLTVFSMLTIYDDDSWNPQGCYVKILVKGKNAIFAAESYKGNDVEGKIGLHLQMSQTATNGASSIVCLEFSCPYTDDEITTYVKIAPLTKSCTFKPGSFHPDLSDIQYPANFSSLERIGISQDDYNERVKPPTIKGEERWFWIAQHITGQSVYGLFRFSGRGKANAKAKCLTGKQDYIETSPDEIREIGSALEYNCS